MVPVSADEMKNDGDWLDEVEVCVDLLKGENRVGFSMCGGREESWPSVVNDVITGSPADRGGLNVGDEIIEVNGVSVEAATHAEIVQHIHEITEHSIESEKKTKFRAEANCNNETGEKRIIANTRYNPPALNGLYEEDEVEEGEDWKGSPPPPVPTTAPPPLNSEESEKEREERLKFYEEELKRRKEREEKMAKEQEFLRSSLRGSKKLQALEKNLKNQTNSGLENVAYEQSEEGQSVGLEEVLLSVDKVVESLEKLPEHRKDGEFLRKLFAEQQIHDAIEVTAAVHKHWCSKPRTTPLSSQAFQHSDGVLKQLGDSISDPAGELQEILEKPHLQATLYTHDKLASQLFPDECCSTVPSTSSDIALSCENTPIGLKETSLDNSDTNLRIVKVLKDSDHYLGATVKQDGEKIVVGRIVKGGVADKSKLLQENDEILEVNSIDLRGKSVNDVCDLLIFQIVSHVNYEWTSKGDILHVLSMEDPNWWQAFREGDDLNTQTLAGLIPSDTFQTQRELYKREILGQVPGTKANNNNNNNNNSVKDHGKTSLLCAKRAKKTGKNSSSSKSGGKVTHLGSGSARNYNTINQEFNQNTMQNGSALANKESFNYYDADFNETDDETVPVLTYEEVCLHLSKSGHKRPVVLVGPPNVGCLDLRARLMETDKERFAGVVPHTSRPKRSHEVEGVHYSFVTKHQFQQDVNLGKFVEWGEYQKHFYGTSFQAIQRVVDSGKTCILTLKAQSLRNLRDGRLMPYVVFISPPSFERLKINRIKQQQRTNIILKDEDLKSIIQEGKDTEAEYGHLFDKVIVNIDLERSFQELRNIVHRLDTEPHWVPSDWLQHSQSNFSSLAKY